VHGNVFAVLCSSGNPSGFVIPDWITRRIIDGE
jgi:hypothetical protein